MHSSHLNEHDANQGAQSSGEFLGMTGNSGWYLLGSSGATIMMVIFLWGVLGVSLLLCLFVGLILCLGSVAYVFTLKNNRPEHYDTDFLESSLVEAGVLSFAFGPRNMRPVNPFMDTGEAESAPAPASKTAPAKRLAIARRSNSSVLVSPVRAPALEAVENAEEPVENGGKRKPAPAIQKPVAPQSDYERLQEELTTTEEMLEDALAEAAEA